MCDEVFTACLKLSYRIHLHCFMWIFVFEGEKIGKRKINQPQTWLVSALAQLMNCMCLSLQKEKLWLCFIEYSFATKHIKIFFVLVQFIPITFYFFQERSFTKQSKLIHYTIKIF